MPVTKNRPTLVPQHPLTRYVSEESIALLLERSPQEIRRIDCWRHVIHVVAPGLSTFVSYADLPPLLGVAVPVATDVRLWRRRWRTKDYLAPKFWREFYGQKLAAAKDLGEMSAWDELIAYIAFGLSDRDRQYLESICLETTLRLSVSAA
jgi:hypothetical protein